MSINHSSNSLRALPTVLFLALLLTPVLVWGEENSEDTLGLFTAWQEQSSTASRAPKPLSQTAENVTVVTAQEIEALNAHTLADILDTIPGIQVEHNGGPGITAYPHIQSSNFRHVQIFLDGVSITNLLGDFSEVSIIPARIIERIEIVKGAASSAWGQALGGVIYVVTKAPEKERPIGGSASTSIGEQTTTDSGAELTGTSGGVGYYLSGGYLGSNGLLPGTDVNANHAHAKLTYDLPARGQLFAIFDYFKTNQGDLFVPDYDLKERQHKRLMLATIGLRYPLTEALELEVTGRHSYLRNNTAWYNISDGAPWSWQPLPAGISSESVSGASVKLTWRESSNLLVVGSDYNHEEVKSNTTDNTNFDPFSRKVERYGVYLNDTLTIGPVSVAPGIRFDHTQTSGDQFSSSLGATWQLDDKTVLRAYTARGYGLPELTFLDTPSVKIWTTQVGAESTAIPYLWLKGTLFRNMVWGEGIEQHLALGTELEAHTTPVFNTSLGAGYTFTDTTRTSNGTEVNELPRHTVQLALRYDDKTFRGVLTGRHIFWNSLPEDNGKYGLIWDLHLGATLLKREYSSLELFFSGHNLFNGAQSLYPQLVPNTGRWFEGGMKVRF